MSISVLFFLIFKARYCIVRMKLKTLHSISTIEEEKFLLVKEDETIRWVNSSDEATPMGLIRAALWLFPLRNTQDGYFYSKVSINDERTAHYLPGNTTTLFI